ncbi:zf-HC2 domain-containing protein [Marinobacter sp.]|uniref:anti-sigma factor family protein n=1 Tax=Marinobacter sp. TaxID=50741 RepID=UPI00384B0CA6
MLSCRGLAYIASDYIDDELGRVNRMSVRMHLMMCPRCRSFIESLRTSTELLERHSGQPLSEEYARSIDRQIERALADRHDR